VIANESLDHLIANLDKIRLDKIERKILMLIDSSIRKWIIDIVRYDNYLIIASTA